MIFFTLTKLFSDPNETISFVGPGLFQLTKEYDMISVDIYEKILYTIYITPYVLWILVVMYQKNFKIWEMSPFLLIFTVVGIFIGLVVKMQAVYMERNVIYDTITYISIGLYYIVFGIRNTFIQSSGVGDFFNLPEQTGRVVAAETYLTMALSLSIVFIVALMIMVHDMSSRFQHQIEE